ncbi:uncharacterized membrane protein YraQ (UPF0718 family) [Natronocella acetinitrilica]|jgi:uncharacterized membrane protein YraQ (UPF0718 family)|uniref:Uncharacterized membrane protein YraQ (UPF0718 family) n=1 Tax=Natronocella acetinitrilica TaxID=414046 RepID=A0AAE3G530_9GAMM|nr:hypothetical protein [Natronocella acetinitrilica]MCP1675960.1 uncharacterized membrane protein YraQ (UPF0718 family) [Natronocella acetinitrilica]
MLIAYLSVVSMLAAVALIAHRTSEVSHRDIALRGLSQLRPLLIRLPAALLAGSFLAALIPEGWLLLLLGDASGVAGVLLASLLGAVLPGGPLVAFPLALVLFSAGVGTPQMVALITAWSVLAFHRVLAFEIPLMGWGFAWRRLAASAILAPIAGLLVLILQ